MQFDVYPNPVTAARTIHPYVVVLQSEAATNSTETIVAPLVLRSRLPTVAGRLLPIVALDDREYVVVTQALVTLPLADLKRRAANLAKYRGPLLGAIDLLFFGL
jgi:hypothetical protein